MKFVDEVQITVQSGHGGPGCVSFRRERFVPKGGPDGGDGGHGGNVIFRALIKKRTLYHLRFNNQFKAGNGIGGQGAKRAGKAGKDLVINIPVGTVITDADTNFVLCDLAKDNDFFVVAEGGRGGRGNIKFKSSTNRVPRFAQPGEPGFMVSLKLELKSLADVGIVGLPNAGKSTLLSVISSAKPKVASYPFTTLVPNLGIVSINDIESFVVADIPGLVKGAHRGVGLGIRFLKHIERTRLVVHLVDASQIDLYDPMSCVKMIDDELALYSAEIAIKPCLLVLNKIDISSTGKAVESLTRVLSSAKYEFLCISAITGEGVRALVLKLAEMLSQSVVS